MNIINLGMTYHSMCLVICQEFSGSLSAMKSAGTVVAMHFCRTSLQWRHNERDGVSNHQRLHCLLYCWFRRRRKKTPKFCDTGLCEGNLPATSELPAQKARNSINISIWLHHHGILICKYHKPSHYTQGPKWQKKVSWSCIHSWSTHDLWDTFPCPSNIWVLKSPCMPYGAFSYDGHRHQQRCRAIKHNGSFYGERLGLP